MRLIPPLRTLTAALGLAVAAAAWTGAPLGGSDGRAWAQEAVTDAPTAATDVEATQNADTGAAGSDQSATGERTQDGGAADEGASVADEAPAADEDTDATATPAEEGAAPAADASTAEGAPAEPSDSTDGADEAAPDASGNSSDDPNPAASPDEGGVTVAEDQASAVGGDLPVIGAPWQGGIDFQPPGTGVAEDLQWLDGMLNWIIGTIVVFVTGLLAWVILRFNERRNPTPAGFTHNSPLEIAWTIVPIVILVFIGAFSLPVLFEEQEIPEGDLYIKATGNQWFWTYEYVDDAVLFDSYMIGYGAPPMTEAEDDPVRAELAQAGYDASLYKLATDTALVVPVDTTVVVTVTGADVIHSWAVPAFGVKQDAVPGRLAQTWFRAETEGIFFGQCSELCGKDHAFMPITVRVVSREAYDAWLLTAQEQFAA